jgi:hypothetical protein
MRLPRRSAGFLLAAASTVWSAAGALAQPTVDAHALVAVVSRNSVSLSWQAPTAPPSPVLGYILDVGLTPGTTAFSSPLGNVLAFATTAPDGVYFVRVRAVTGAGPSGPSNEVQLVTGQAGPPLAPATFTAAAAGLTLSAQWTENPLGPVITSYVLRAGSAPGLANLGTVPFAATTRSFAANVPSGTYYLRLHAANAAGLGPPSTEVVVVVSPGVCAPPGAPSGLVAAPVAGGVGLAWNPPATGGPPTGYRLDVGTSSGATNLGAVPVGLVTSLAAPAPAGTYFVRVVALNACGASPPSNQVSFTVPLAIPNMVGVWDGQVFNAPFVPGRGRISSFVLTITAQPTTATLRVGRWQDNLGCVNNNAFGFVSNGALVLSVESLLCTDGDS